jgi:hypothetical protein
MTPEPVERPSARVLLLDETDRVLLFRGFDPHRPHERFWPPARPWELDV